MRCFLDEVLTFFDENAEEKARAVQLAKQPPDLKNIRYSFSCRLRYLIVIIIINMRHDTQEGYI